MALFSGLAALLAFFPVAFAAPALETRASITALSTSQVSSFKPFTYYASTTACTPAAVLAWNCGSNCEANPTFVPVASGGDGGVVQYWYVGFDPTLQTVIVAHQGTDVTKLAADLTDLNIIPEPLDSSLFPGLNSSIQVHSGFANEHAKTASLVLSAVTTAISKFGANQVTIVGHSLGAALSLLDSVYLPLHISGVTWKTVLYGLPRVGNQEFADYVDASDSTLTHINNMKDPIPTLPSLFLGFHHPSGEVHITESSVWEACPGQDNPSDLCIVGDVPNLLVSDLDNHGGPYDGVEMGCSN